MTLRLYYHDAHLTDFDATVLELRRSGGRPAAVLDRTAFYPESGGQPCDTGTLGGARVVAVEEEEPSGVILHFLDTPVEPGSVRGSVDWGRRFDHMQQHTGQHILSQAFVKVADAATLSFHLGAALSTIDIALAEPSESDMERAEALASRIVFENRPVEVLFVDRDTQDALGVRKASDREGEIRVVQVEGFDRSPCGGTHVRRTGEIGLISVLGFERYKGGTRVEFVCGGRALRVVRADHDLLRELGGIFSAGAADLPRLAAKLLEERAELSRENARLLDQLLDLEARAMLARSAGAGAPLIIRRTLEERGLEAAKVLARKLAAQPGVVAILAVKAEPCQVVVARSADLPGDCGAAVKQAAAAYGGRGGGRADAAQAGGIEAAKLEKWCDTIEAHFR